MAEQETRWTYDTFGRPRDLDHEGRALLRNGRPVVQGDDAIFEVRAEKLASVGVRWPGGSSIEYSLVPVRSRLGSWVAMLKDRVDKLLNGKPDPSCYTGVWRQYF